MRIFFIPISSLLGLSSLVFFWISEQRPKITAIATNYHLHTPVRSSLPCSFLPSTIPVALHLPPVATSQACVTPSFPSPLPPALFYLPPSPLQHPPLSFSPNSPFLPHTLVSQDFNLSTFTKPSTLFTAGIFSSRCYYTLLSLSSLISCMVLKISDFFPSQTGPSLPTFTFTRHSLLQLVNFTTSSVIMKFAMYLGSVLAMGSVVLAQGNDLGGCAVSSFNPTPSSRKNQNGY